MALQTALTAQINTEVLVSAIIVDAYSNAANDTVVWTTSSATVATVQAVWNNSTKAVIRCLTVGTATITATSNSKTATFALNVINQPATVTAQIDVVANQSAQPTRMQSTENLP